MDERDIQRKHSFPKQRRYLRQKDGDVIAATVINGLADIRTDKECIHAKTIRELRIRIRGRAFGVKMNDLDIAQVRSSVDECVDKNVRSSGDSMNENPIARTDRRNCVGST